MAILTIEWRHYYKDGETCLRCSTTGRTLVDAVNDLRRELEPNDIEIEFIETKLPVEKIHESNMILINGRPIENVLAGAKASESSCASCSCLTGTETACRTIEFAGVTYEEIPEEMIRSAVYKAAGKAEN